MVLHKTIDGMVTCSDWDDLATTFLGEGRNRYHCSYVIFTDGTDTYAQNGTTGAIDYGGPDDNGTVDGADEAAVIQAAIDSVNTSLGGKIFVKGGNYTLDSVITIRNRVWLCGMGSLRTRFYINHNGIGIQTAANAEDIHLKDFEIAGNGVNTANIHINNGFGSHGSLENLYCWNSGGDGALINSTVADSSNGFSIINCRFLANGQHGLHLSGQGMNAITIKDSFFSNNTEQGIRWAATGSGHDVTGCVFETNDYGIYFTAGTTGSFFEFYMDGNTSYGACVDNCDGLVFSGCFVINPVGAVGIGFLAGCENNTIIGGHFGDYVVAGTHIEIQAGANYTTIISPEHTGTSTWITNAGTQTEVYGGEYRNHGTATFSGDGTTTAFNIAHGLVATPTYVGLEAESAGAVGDKYWSAGAVNITVTFITAPPTGVNNVVIGWKGEVRP